MDMVQKVLGNIDFDPASDRYANKIVQADTYHSHDSLDCHWPKGSIYLNPPGGKIGNESQAVLFWKRLMEHRQRWINVATDHLGRCDFFTHAIFMAFSLEQMRISRKPPVIKSMFDFPFCIPDQRLRFYYMASSGRLEEGTRPTHSNALIYVPGAVDETKKFKEVFSQIGQVLNV